MAKSNDLKLIELVKQNRHLYDKSHKDYRDHIKKEMTWKEIAETLGYPEADLRKRFKNLRDRFTKEKRRKDVHNDPTLPSIFKKMLFLADHLRHRQREDDSPLNDTNESPEMSDDTLQGNELDQTEKPSSYIGGLENQIVYVLDESGNLIHQGGSPFELEDSSDGGNSDIKQPDDLLACDEQTEHKDDVSSPEKSLENSVGEDLDDKVESEGNAKKNRASNGMGESEDDQRTRAGEIVVAVYGNNGETQTVLWTERSSKSGSDREKIEPAQLSEEEQNIEGNSSRILRNGVSKTDDKKSLPVIVNTFTGTIRKGHGVRGRPRKLHCLRKRQMLSKKHAREMQIKKQEITVQMPKQADTSSECKVDAFKNSNKSFCVMVKHYLDKITVPNQLSSARLQILTLLHNELYST